MVKSMEPYQKDMMGSILKKLDNCRNEENNPESDMSVKYTVIGFSSVCHVNKYLLTFLFTTCMHNW